MATHLVGPSSADSRKNELESRMAKLYSFMTKPVQLLVNYRPNQYIDVCKRLEVKYNSTSSAKNTRKTSKMGILVGVFEKYLKCRLPEAFIEVEGDVIKFLVEAIISSSCERIEDFTINELWSLMEIIYFLRLDPSEVLENKLTLFGKKIVLGNFSTEVFRKISYFGEFLYFCATVPVLEGSPLYNTISMCDAKEAHVIEDIRRNLTPELGISTFLVSRNWISDSFPKTRENMEFWIKKKKSNKSLELFYDTYSKSLETIEKCELLHKCFKRFLIFLGSEASSAHRYFDLYVLQSVGFLKGFKSKKGFLYVNDINKYLLKLIKLFAEALLYVYNTNSETICFNELPNFFNNYWNSSNCESEFLPIYIYDATQLMDFVFVDQFHNRFTSAYYEICVAISKLVIERFDFTYTIDPMITKFCLFPFFGMRNAE